VKFYLSALVGVVIKGEYICELLSSQVNLSLDEYKCRHLEASAAFTITCQLFLPQAMTGVDITVGVSPS